MASFILKKDKSDLPPTPDDPRPHVRVIEVHPDAFEEQSLDAVTIKDYERNRSCDYRLDYIRDEGTFFILAPKDIIKAMPRSFDDHIKWLMERCHFEQALDEIRNAPANKINVYTYQVIMAYGFRFEIDNNKLTLMIIKYSYLLTR
jgi:hypothetical protein